MKKKQQYWAPSIAQTLAGMVLTAGLTIPSAEAKEAPLPEGTPTQQAQILIEQGRTEQANKVLFQQETAYKQINPEYKTPTKEHILKIITTADSINILNYWNSGQKIDDIKKRFSEVIANFEQEPVETLYLLRPELKQTMQTRTYQRLSEKLDDLAEDNIEARAGRFFTALLEADYATATRDIGFLALQYADKRETYAETFAKLASYAFKQSTQLEVYVDWANKKDKPTAEILEKEQRKMAADYKGFMRMLYIMNWDKHDELKTELENNKQDIIDKTDGKNYEKAAKEIN